MDSIITGLNQSEVQKRRTQFGPNEIPAERPSLVLDFLKRLTGLSSLVIEASLIIMIFIRHYLEAAVMAFLLLFNAVLGFVQEFRASRALELLMKRITVTVKVLRDGTWQQSSSSELVPDDIIKVAAGDVVPADALIIDGNISADESPLTGESLPAERKENEKIFSGSLVTRGQAIARVTATGRHTFYGKTAELIEKTRPRLIIENMTMSVTRGLLLVDAFFIIAVLIKFDLNHLPLLSALPVVLTLLIASIPVALPAMTILSLSLGSLELARKGVLVRKLDGIENSAMMDILCLDKTGTITENRIKISEVICLSDAFNQKQVLALAQAASDQVSLDPIDSAIVEYGNELGAESVDRLNFRPFDPETKLASAEVEHQGRKTEVIKGAPQVLLAQLPDSAVKKEIENHLARLATSGQRTLLVAIRTEEAGLKPIGLLSFFDYPRKDSRDFIARIKNLGISVRMITGDNQLIASQVARTVGLEEKVATWKSGGQANPSSLPEAEVFAEVLPEDKFALVNFYQSRGHTVGMTGDGVNDAPALRKADLGIAVSNSLDIAKEAAKVILTSPGLSNIVDLILTGRKIYRRIILWIINKVVKTFQIVFFVSAATLILGKPVITPVAMILMLFLFDFVTISIATDNLEGAERPEKWSLEKLLAMSLIFGCLKILELFLAMYLILKFWPLSFEQVQSLMFYLLLVSGILNILNFRERKMFFHSRPSWPLMIFIILDLIVASVVVAGGIFMARVPLYYVLQVLAYAFLVTLLFTDLIKILLYRWKGGKIFIL
ncbi:MAG: plasma-membrane proton-efflux P-type ATPase [Candidatus Aminicenantes bacterium]|nr:plasma-membrane proton-efflux P-type ATPase [Candidatus Aminicenantes bacterium]